MSDTRSILDITDHACKAELSVYRSGEPPSPLRLCITLRLWSDTTPGRVTPATAEWALQLRRLEAPSSARATPTPVCNGHVEGDGPPAPTSRASSPGVTAAQDADSATKTLLAHLQVLGDWCRETGRADQLYAVTGSAELAVAQLEWLQYVVSEEDVAAWLTERRGAAERLLRRLQQQLLSWHRRQLAARLLTDPGSQDWQSPRPAEEGGRCSFSVHWWWLHMQAVRHDARQALSAARAGRLFAALLTESLGQIAVHYGQVTLESEERADQLRCDLMTALLAASELVLAVAADPEELFDSGAREESPAALVAGQCRVLLLLLGHLAAPLKTVHKRCGRGAARLQPPPASWLALVRPGLVPPDAAAPRQLDSNVAVYLLVRLLAAAFPAPSCWPLLARALLERDFTLSVLLLVHLTERSEMGESPEPSGGGSARSACHGVLCCDAPEEGCAAHGAVSPRALFSALVLAVTRAAPSGQPLRALLAPCLDRLTDRGCPSLWNQRRPLWLQALVDLAEPLMSSVVAAIVEDIQESTDVKPQNRAVTLLQYAAEIADDLPPVLFDLGELPVESPPLGLAAHVLLSALYDALNDQETVMRAAASGSERRVANACVTLGEALCRPEEDLQREMSALADSLRTLVCGPLPADPEDGEGSASLPAAAAAVEQAARISADHAGRRALWLISAVLRENGGWLRRRLGVPAPLASAAEPAGGALSLRLHDEPVFWPAAALLQMGGGRLEQGRLLELRPDWRALLAADLGQTEALVRSLVARRWELQPDAALADGQAEMVETLRRRLQLL